MGMEDLYDARIAKLVTPHGVIRASWFYVHEQGRTQQR
jgi:hypothetical protein